MKRMKTFFIYALLVAIVIVLTDIIINVILNINYREITNYKIETNNPSISVKQAKTTNANGYIEGTLTNDSDSDIEKTYVKVDLLGKGGNIIGSEYTEVDDLKQNESKEFRISYKKWNVDSFNIGLTDEVVNKNIQLTPLIKYAERYFAAALLISIAPFYFF